jgi:hypothetical protein
MVRSGDGMDKSRDKPLSEVDEVDDTILGSLTCYFAATVRRIQYDATSRLQMVQGVFDSNSSSAKSRF